MRRCVPKKNVFFTVNYKNTFCVFNFCNTSRLKIKILAEKYWFLVFGRDETLLLKVGVRCRRNDTFFKKVRMSRAKCIFEFRATKSQHVACKTNQNCCRKRSRLHEALLLTSQSQSRTKPTKIVDKSDFVYTRRYFYQVLGMLPDGPPLPRRWAPRGPKVRPQQEPAHPNLIL